jgi:hypothetical protein
MAPRESRGKRNASQWRGLYLLKKDSSTKCRERIGGAREKSANQAVWEHEK